MKDDETRKSLPIRGERIRFESTFSGKYRVLALFLICSALLVAAFAIGGAWHAIEKNMEETTLSTGGGESPDANGEAIAGTGVTNSEGMHEPDRVPEDEEPPKIPVGCVPIIGMDLSHTDQGIGYLVNETAYRPSSEALLDRVLPNLKTSEGPTVLILHTHTSEGYAKTDSPYFDGLPGDLTYTRDEGSNVLAVGAALARVLNEGGILTIHCTELFDENGLRGSYSASGEAVKRYLAMYPSIRLVIDLHRDAVLDAEGNYIRTEAAGCEQRTAQVMAVVGTDGNGTIHTRWQDNLALALQLRRVLNGEGRTLCRPVALRNASYNQEMAPYSLLLELGTGANTVEEAIRCAEETGRALLTLLSGG